MRTRMPTIQATSIELVPSAGESLAGYTIDLPRVRQPIDGHFLEIAGWVVGRDDKAVKIEVRHDTHWLTGIPVQLVRPDVVNHLGLADPSLPSGFQLAFSTIGLPEEFELSVWALLADGQAVEFARLRGTHTPLRSAFRPAVQPLSVTSLGRTGTTLLMRMLAEHPEICLDRVHPFETRHGAYWMHVLTVLSAPANHSSSSHPDQFQHERLFIGNNPYAWVPGSVGPTLRSWFSSDAPGELAAFCQRNIDAAYLRIARDQGKPPARFFAEKNTPTYAARLLSQLYDGAKEIILVRDFRDMICSMLAFDGKRRTRDFQRDDIGADAFVVRVVEEFRQLLAALNERRASALLVRYEDLVAEPHATLRRIAEYAGVDASPDVIERMIEATRMDDEATRAHRTTDNGPGSVGRYRYDMNEDLRGLCQAIGGDLLSRLGYASEPTGASHRNGAVSVRA
jgi:hypothetical protein